MDRDVAATTGSTFRTVNIRAGDGVYLEGWIFEPPSPNRNIAFVAHEMGGSRLSLLHFVNFLLRDGYVCLGSRGTRPRPQRRLRHDIRHPRTSRCRHLGRQAPRCVPVRAPHRGRWRLARRHCSPAGCNCRRRSVRHRRRLRWRRPSTPYRHVADHIGISDVWAQRLFSPFVEPLFLNARLRHGLDLRDAAPVHAVSRLSIPVLLIHGLDDGFIPVGHARRLHAANPRYTSMWEIAGASHTRTDEVAGLEYQRRVISFLRDATLLYNGPLPRGELAP